MSCVDIRRDLAGGGVRSYEWHVSEYAYVIMLTVCLATHVLRLLDGDVMSRLPMPTRQRNILSCSDSTHTCL